MPTRSKPHLPILFAFLAIVAIVLWGYVHWKMGKPERDWDAFKAEMDAKGVPYYFLQLLPTGVPDEENFAYTPILRPLFTYEWNEDGTGFSADNAQTPSKELNKLLKTRLPFRTRKSREWLKDWEITHSKSGDMGWFHGTPLDLGIYQAYFRDKPEWPSPETLGDPAEDVLFAVNQFGEVIEKVVKASKERPRFLPEFPPGAFDKDKLDIYYPSSGSFLLLFWE